MQILNQIFLRCLRKRGNGNSLGNQKLEAIHDVVGIGAHVHTKWCGRALFCFGNRHNEFVVGHRGRRDDSECTCIRCRGNEFRPGNPAHTCLDNRILRSEEIEQWSRECGMHQAAGSSRSRNDLGSRTSRNTRSSSSVGSRVVGMSDGITSSNEHAAVTSSIETPGCNDATRIR